MKALSVIEQTERHAILKGIIRDGAQIFVEVGNALLEEKTFRYYLQDGYKTFEEFCEKEYKWGKRHANELIQASKAVLSLPPAKASAVKSIKAAQVLASMPPAKAVETIEKVEASGLPVTAKTLKAASAPPPKRPSEALNREKDSTGLYIPSALLQVWQSRSEVQELLSLLSTLRSAARLAERSKNNLFTRVPFNSVFSHLDQAYADILMAKPVAVCPNCGGNEEVTKECTLCKGLGLLSEFHYRAVSEPMKKLREKAVAMQK